MLKDQLIRKMTKLKDQLIHKMTKLKDQLMRKKLKDQLSCGGLSQMRPMSGEFQRTVAPCSDSPTAGQKAANFQVGKCFVDCLRILLGHMLLLRSTLPHVPAS